MLRVGSDGVEQKVPLPSIDDLKQYLSRLKQLVRTHQTNIETLLQEQTKMQREQETELEKWTKFANDDLLSMSTGYHTAKLQHVSGLIDIEWRIVEILTNEGINRIQSIIDLNRGFESLSRDINAQGNLMSFQEIAVAPWVRSDELEACKVRTGELNEKVGQLGFAYNELRKRALREESYAERHKRLQDLIQKGVEHQPATRKLGDRYYHACNPHLQGQFRTMIADERTPEGQLLRQWREMLNDAGASNISPEAIEAFIQHLVLDMLKRYNLPRDPELQVIPSLRLYVDRLVFPRVKDVLYHMETSREREGDLTLQRKCHWLRRLSEAQCEIEPIFRQPPDLDQSKFPAHLRPSLPKWEKLPYGYAIESLSKLRNELVPSDIFHRILQSVRSIYDLATIYHDHTQSKKEEAVSSMSVSLSSSISSSLSLSASSSHSQQASASLSISSSTSMSFSIESSSSSSAAIDIPRPISPRPSGGSSVSSSPADSIRLSPARTSLNSVGSEPVTASSPSVSKSPQKTPAMSRTKSLKDTLIISADSLFPIVVWVVIQAGLDNLHRCIGHIERFIPSQRSISGKWV